MARRYKEENSRMAEDPLREEELESQWEAAPAVVVVFALLALVSFANAFLVLAVIASLVRGEERSGAQLLLKAITVWGTNVITFGLWFWLLDRGGPVRRRRPNPPPPDFLFPQLDSPKLAPGWEPHLVDYVYVAFTNAIAFSPTDVLPLTRLAKLLMLLESALSALTILLVAARAVNIFRGGRRR